MNFSVYNSLPIGQVYAVNTPKLQAYKPSYSGKDNVSVNRELDRLLDRKVIEDMIRSNPAIISVLKSQNLKPVVNVENFKRTTYKHSIDTKNHAVGIYNALPVDLKAEANLGYIQKGALLHDIGKVLIPEKVLNKQGKLNPNEAEIMHLHSKLSEALLSTQNIEPEVLNIVKYHHQNEKGSGYPEMRNSLMGFDINTEVVTLADKYSALTEHRSYKRSMTPEEALAVIKKDVDEGNINPRVYNALVGYVNNKEQAALNPKEIAA